MVLVNLVNLLSEALVPKHVTPEGVERPQQGAAPRFRG